MTIKVGDVVRHYQYTKRIGVVTRVGATQNWCNEMIEVKVLTGSKKGELVLELDCTLINQEGVMSVEELDGWRKKA